MHTAIRLALSASLFMSLPLLGACGGDDDDVAPIDGGRRDLGSDAGALDAGAREDAAADDGGARDAATNDASASDAGGTDAGNVDLGPSTPPDCAAQDARGVGACEAIVGTFFNGENCVAISGCSCEGTKCGDGFDSIEACEAVYSECIAGPSCAAILCGPGTSCIDCPRGGRCVAPGGGCP